MKAKSDTVDWRAIENGSFDFRWMRRKLGEGFRDQGAKVRDRTANATLLGCGSNYEN